MSYLHIELRSIVAKQNTAHWPKPFIRLRFPLRQGFGGQESYGGFSTILSARLRRADNAEENKKKPLLAFCHFFKRHKKFYPLFRKLVFYGPDHKALKIIALNMLAAKLLRRFRVDPGLKLIAA